ncbi:UNVERIFIED_CONTAM: hypothetical protein Sangu_1402400 [Sesamum angustifolium]|uniref:Uncharacterized protein n=1 Tax=Sesamum angustifolium TaxID=2727405 RepID=A0AAW2N6S6_9LAMI
MELFYVSLLSLFILLVSVSLHFLFYKNKSASGGTERMAVLGRAGILSPAGRVPGIHIRPPVRQRFSGRTFSGRRP